MAPVAERMIGILGGRPPYHIGADGKGQSGPDSLPQWPGTSIGTGTRPDFEIVHDTGGGVPVVAEECCWGRRGREGKKSKRYWQKASRDCWW